jgi:hypothetical protein
LYEADIIPISMLPYEPGPQYEHELPDSEISKVAKPVWLTTKAKQDVRSCLEVQGLEPSDYITSATVHGDWKITMHQGIIYAKSVKDITREADPSKPVPSSRDISLLFEEKRVALRKTKTYE